MECEFGTSMPIRFLSPENVKAYDSEGKEMIIPKCERCDDFKNQLIGKKSFMWLCPSCGGP